MSDGLSAPLLSGTGKIVAAAVVGATGGLMATMLILGSPEFGIFVGVGGALAAMIGTLARFEPSEA